MNLDKLTEIESTLNLIRGRKYKQPIREVIDFCKKNINRENLEEDIKNLQKTVGDLNNDVTNLQTAKENLNEKMVFLKEDLNKSKEQLSNTKKEYSDLEQSKGELRSDINKLKENKTFYAETLSGHKKETHKLFWVNVVAFLLIICGLIGFAFCIFLFYQDAIDQIARIDSKVKIGFLFFARGGAGVIFYFIIRFLINLAHKILTELYSIFKDQRDIESKLILAREIAFSTETNIPFKGDDEKRNYLSFLKLSVLKNHFMNLESVKKDLSIKNNKLDQINKTGE